MKTVFIVFAILLFLLTLLSSFGGSIRKEPYYDSNPVIVPEGFFEEQKESMPAPSLVKGPETDVSKLGLEEKKEKFEEEMNEEEVPEPFEDLEEFQVGAPF